MKKMAPQVGLEPTTLRLTASRDAANPGGSKHRDPCLTQNLVPITDLFEHLRATIAEATLLYQLGASVLET